MFPVDFYLNRASDVPLEKFCYLDMGWMLATRDSEQALLPYRQLDAQNKRKAYDDAAAAGASPADLWPLWVEFDRANKLAMGTPYEIATLNQAIQTYPQRSQNPPTWDSIFQKFREMPDRFNDFLRQYGVQFTYTVTQYDLGITQRELYTSPDEWNRGSIEGDEQCGVCLQNEQPAGQGLHNNQLFPILYDRRPWKMAQTRPDFWREDRREDGSPFEVGRVVSVTIDGGGHDAGFPPSTPANDCGKASTGAWQLRRTITGVNDHCAVLWGYGSEIDMQMADVFHEYLHASDVWCHPNDQIPEDNGYRLTWLNAFPTLPGGFLSPGQLHQLKTRNTRFLRPVLVPDAPPIPEPTPEPITLLSIDTAPAILTVRQNEEYVTVTTARYSDGHTATVPAQLASSNTKRVRTDGQKVIGRDRTPGNSTVLVTATYQGKTDTLNVRVIR